MERRVMEDTVMLLREGTLTTDGANKLLEHLGIVDEVESYEQNEQGHVYTMIDGSVVVLHPTVLVVARITTNREF